LVVVLLAWPAVGAAQAWPDSAAGRRAAHAALAAFEAALDATPSATEALSRWCASHGIADPPVIRAARGGGPDKAADARTRRLLGADPDEPLGYRHVQLMCGAHSLSEADNWYRPGLLTPEMNRRLTETDAPFGVVTRPLNFRRQTLDVRWLFDPLTAPRAPGARGALVMPHAVLRHRALLIDGDGAPFSLVEETYTAEILAFPPPTPAVRSRR
jgi:hypothetical protein